MTESNPGGDRLRKEKAAVLPDCIPQYLLEISPV
jgi:hypothetical protein